MEGRMRALKQFDVSWWRRTFDCILCCLKPIKDKYLKGNWLTVETTIDPSLILWENQGYNSAQRVGRQLAIFLMTCVIVMLAVFGILWAKKLESTL
jgi:hypothetical protein